MIRSYLFRCLLPLLCIFLAGCEGRTNIVNNVSERDANEIIVLLVSKGIEAQKIPAPTSNVGGGTGAETWNITVPASQITDALSVLNQAGLPRVKGTSLLDLFGTSGLVPSDLQDRIRYQEGLSEQLANTIRKMDGIIDADVQITFPQDEEEKKALTASVYVKHRGILDNPNSLTITKIKRLVSSAIPGLTVENVSVVADRALYSDISLDPLEKLEEEKAYVSIWGIVVARESANHFRILFYCFMILLFVLACMCAWLLWKFYPLIQQRGVMFLLYPEQYDVIPLVEEEKEE